jgi:hypothetical protein
MALPEMPDHELLLKAAQNADRLQRHLHGLQTPPAGVGPGRPAIESPDQLNKAIASLERLQQILQKELLAS